MIDIAPYEQKLTWLREWMEYQISESDFIKKHVIYQYDVMHKVIYGDKYNGQYEHLLAGPFEAYCKYKQSIQC